MGMKSDVLFIHITKTGGTSLRDLFKIDWIRHIGDPKKRGMVNSGRVSIAHASLDLAIQTGIMTEEFLKRSFKFAFVRNPYDRAISEFFYAQNVGKPGSKSIDDWFRNGWFKGHSDFRPQVDYLNGPYDMDFIGKFENLEEDAKEVAKLLGDGDVDVPHLNRTNHKDYSIYYTPQIQEEVFSFYRRDFNQFGYDPEIDYTVKDIVRGETVILIGDGPSKHKILHQASSIKEDVAVVNAVMYQWKGRSHYWYTLHPSVFFLEEERGKFTARMIGEGQRTRGTALFEKVNERLYPGCGSSSRFAAERLLNVEGYKKIHIYGVDLEGSYERYRHHWTELLKEHSDKIIDHSMSGWMERIMHDTK